MKIVDIGNAVTILGYSEAVVNVRQDIINGLDDWKFVVNAHGFKILFTLSKRYLNASPISEK